MKTYRTKNAEMTAEQLAQAYQNQNPELNFGYTKDDSAIGFFAEGRWWVFASGAITGDWVQVYPQGMPLINGERPYPDDQFISVK